MTNTHGDSPTKPRHTHSHEYRSTHVADSRKTLTRDIPKVQEVYLDSLMDAVLPPLSPGTLDEVYKTLKADNHIKNPDTDSSRWDCLPRDPSAIPTSETEKFRFLQQISQAIITSQHVEPTPNIRLEVAGQITPLSKRRNTSRPDGYFHITNADPGHPKWADIIMPMEFKSVHNKHNQIDDFGKVMWSMHHIMRNDARRRYVYGLTCENTRARLWYNDRADVVASQEFDVNKDWKRLVRIILSILLATDVQLGYSPNILLVPSNDRTSEPSYDITIHNSDTGMTTTYRTIRMISDVGADSMVGRGTRVWEVRRLVDGKLVGPSYALKDTWIHEDRVPEHVIIQKVRKEQPNYAQHFLTPIDYGFAPFDCAEPSIPDNTHKTLRQKELKPTRKFLLTYSASFSASHTASSRSQKNTNSVRDSVGHSDDIPDSPLEGHQAFLLSIHPRQHYYTVFEEIGTPVHDLRKFTHIFTAIQGGWEGLHAIHLCKYVHRDVSSGNILLVPPKGTWDQRGVIMDVEYGKPTDDTSAAHDVRTGTLIFMATEVVLMDHHRFRSNPSREQPLDSHEPLKSRVRSRMQQRVESPRAPIQVPPFRHNPLHDMESIWWLCIWMMFYLVLPLKDKQDHLDNYHRVFSSASRKIAFASNSGVYRKYTSHLREHQTWVELMELWSDTLEELYSASYAEHGTSAIPPGIVRISEKNIKTSYELGKDFLTELWRASESLPEFVKLSEQPMDSVVPTTQAPPRLTLDCVLLPAAEKSCPK